MDKEKNGKEKKIKNMSKMEKGRIEGLKEELIKSKKVMRINDGHDSEVERKGK